MTSSVVRRTPSFWRPYVIAGLMLLGLSLITWVSFNPRMPFEDGYRVGAVFESSNGLRKGSPVRVAGVDVGKVTEIRKGPGSTTRVVMEIGAQGRPVHRNATARIRPRVFLEGGFKVELSPGSPSAPELADEGTIPLSSTAVPVQLHQALGILDLPTREHFTATLDTTAKALSHGGARGLRRLAPELRPLLRETAWVSQALQGTETHELSRLIAATSRLSGALNRSPDRLGDLVGNLATTVRALHDRDEEIGRSIRQSSRLLAEAPKATSAVDAALPVIDDSVKTATGALEIAPDAFRRSAGRLRELRAFVAPERRETTILALETALRDLPITVTRLAELFPVVKPLTDCLSSHVLPTFNAEVPDGALSTGRPVWQDFVHGLTGLASASQNFDGNGYSLRYQFALEGSSLSTLNVPALGQLVGRTPSHLRSRPLPRPDRKPPPQNPDVPCSTQPLPSLETPDGPAGLQPAEGGGEPGGPLLDPDALEEILDLPNLRRSLRGAR